MTLRRQAWRGALTDAGPLLQQLLLRLGPGVGQGLWARGLAHERPMRMAKQMPAARSYGALS